MPNFQHQFFFHLFFIWNNKTLTYLSRSSTHAFLPPIDLTPLLPHWLVSSLSHRSSLSFSLIDHHCWWVSHLYHFLTVSLYIHIHFSCLPISFLHIMTLELLFCVSIRIKNEWGLSFFFSLKQNISIKIPVIRRSKDWQKEIKQF